MNQRNRLKYLMKEPLVHFTVLAILIFAIWTLFSGSDERAEIIVPAADEQAFTERYQENTGEHPSEEQLQEFRHNWIQEEVLYQEGLSLGLDRSDPKIRARIISKMQLMLAANAIDLEPSEEALRAHLENHSERYRVPARYSYQLASLPAVMGMEPRIYKAALENGADPRMTDLKIQEYRDKPAAFISASQGDALRNLLESHIDQPGEWFLVKLRNGTTAFGQLQAFSPEHLPTVSSIRPRLAADWIKEQRVRATEQRVAELIANYDVSLSREDGTSQ